jgi:hypothetical protein
MTISTGRLVSIVPRRSNRAPPRRNKCSSPPAMIFM